MWYKGFNWEDLHSLKMVAPYKPKLEEDVIKDTCQFGEYVWKNFPEYVCEKENEITSKQLKEYSEWYKKF